MAQLSKTRSVSPYVAKAANGDRPFQYSVEYQDWKAAVLKNKEREIAEADRRWRARFGRSPQK